MIIRNGRTRKQTGFIIGFINKIQKQFSGTTVFIFY